MPNPVTITKEHINAANTMIRAIHAQSAVTSNTRVLLSFGSAMGGYDYIEALREAIMKRFDWRDNSSVYLDSKCYLSHYLTAQKNGRKLNPVWSSLYHSAMTHCKVMVFVVTKVWNDSPWCEWELQNWKNATKGNNGSIPIIIMKFNDVEKLKFETSADPSLNYIAVNKSSDMTSGANLEPELSKLIALLKKNGVGP